MSKNRKRKHPAQIVRQRRIIKAALNQVDTIIVRADMPPRPPRPRAWVYGVGFIY